MARASEITPKQCSNTVAYASLGICVLGTHRRSARLKGLDRAPDPSLRSGSRNASRFARPNSRNLVALRTVVALFLAKGAASVVRIANSLPTKEGGGSRCGSPQRSRSSATREGDVWLPQRESFRSVTSRNLVALRTVVTSPLARGAV